MTALIIFWVIVFVLAVWAALASESFGPFFAIIAFGFLFMLLISAATTGPEEYFQKIEKERYYAHKEKDYYNIILKENQFFKKFEDFKSYTLIDSGNFELYYVYKVDFWGWKNGEYKIKEKS